VRTEAQFHISIVFYKYKHNIYKFYLIIKHSNYKEPTKCAHCDYSTKNSTTLKTHLLNNHSTREERKSEFKFFCECCDYGSFYENFINVHNETAKHKNNVLNFKV